MCQYSKEIEEYIEKITALEPRLCVFVKGFCAKAVCDILKEANVEVISCVITKEHKTALLVSCRFGFALSELLREKAEVSLPEKTARDITLSFGKEWL